MSSRSSKTDRLPASIRNNNRLVVVGRVRRPHGIRGEVVVESMTDVEERFAPGSTVQAMLDGADAEQILELTVDAMRPHSGTLLVAFAGVDDRDRAAKLRGAWLVIDRSQVAAAPEGGHYHFDLVGCACHDHELGLIGEVVDVVEDGGGTLLALRPADADAGAQILVPFVEALLVAVDTDAKRIDMRLPAGLVEICRSRS